MIDNGSALSPEFFLWYRFTIIRMCEYNQVLCDKIIVWEQSNSPNMILNSFWLTHLTHLSHLREMPLLPLIKNKY